MMERKMIYRMMVVALMGMSLSVMAQSNVPTTEFQSTSSMVGSGSAYSSNPSLNTDGTATYNSPSYAPGRTIGGPHYIPPVTPEGDPTPIGDAVVPMLICVAVFCGYMVIRRKRGVIKPA